MQGVIFLLHQPRLTLNLSADLEGKYLLRPVHSSTFMSGRLNSNEPTVIRFFSDTDRAVVFCFCPTDGITDGAVNAAWHRACQSAKPNARPEEVGRFIWAKNGAGQTFEEVSLFLRGSAALTAEGYSEIGRLKATVDARGMAIFSDEPGGDRAGRALVAYMLGLAYHQVLEQAINDLAETCRNDLVESRAEAMHDE